MLSVSHNRHFIQLTWTEYMMTLKHRTANPFGTHRLWLSKCLTNNTVSVSKFDLQNMVIITAVTAHKNFISIHKVDMYQTRLELMANCTAEHLHKHRSYNGIYVAIWCTTDEITENSLRNVCRIIIIFRTLRLTVNTAGTYTHEVVWYLTRSPQISWLLLIIVMVSNNYQTAQ